MGRAAPTFRLAPPPPLLFGAGTLDLMPDEAKARATAPRVAVVADPFLADSGALDPFLAGLAGAGLSPEVFRDLRGEPKLGDVRAAVAACEGAGLVVGIGGGAALDLAKIAALCAGPGADRDPMRYALAANPAPEGRLPLILVPTTAGTGSESSSTAIFSGAAGRKLWIWSERIKPDLALLDPALTVTLPPALTAWCGMDALIHAFEAATNRHANAGAAVHAHAALRLAVEALPRAVAAPDDLAARGDMLFASFLAGVAIDCCGTAIAHNVSHALAGLGPVHHGLATALAFEATLPWLAEAPTPELEAAARACGADSAAALPETISALMDRCGIVRGLPAAFAGIDAARIAREMAAPENAPMRDATARPVRDEDLMRFASAMRALAPVAAA